MRLSLLQTHSAGLRTAFQKLFFFFKLSLVSNNAVNLLPTEFYEEMLVNSVIPFVFSYLPVLSQVSWLGFPVPLGKNKRDYKPKLLQLFVKSQCGHGLAWLVARKLRMWSLLEECADSGLKYVRGFTRQKVGLLQSARAYRFMLIAWAA